MNVYPSDSNRDNATIPMAETVPSSTFVNQNDAFVARQPIFDQNKRVYAYELLFRSSGSSPVSGMLDGNSATSQVIANSLFTFGIRDILSGKPGFFNFTREHLLMDYSGILDPKQTVVEVLESVVPDGEVIDACLRLKAKGYTLALDDFVAKDLSSPLGNYADIVKVDFRDTTLAEQKLVAKHFRSRGVTLLAEKVETVREFSLALQYGYSLFQGYFFARPETVYGKRIPETKKQYHSLLCALNRPDFDYREIEAAIKHDLSLTHKFLLYLNSANFGFKQQISSIHHALVLLGEQQVRTWVSLAIVASMGADKPPELVITGTIRAHFCELLGAKARLKGRSDSLFLLGLFSIMDALMGMPLPELLAGLHIERDVLDTLLGVASAENRLALVYALVCAYEKGDWQIVMDHAQKLGVSEAAIPPMYSEAVHLATRVFAG